MTTPEQKRAAMLRIKQFFAKHAIEGMIRSLPSDGLFLEPLIDDLAAILKSENPAANPRWALFFDSESDADYAKFVIERESVMQVAHPEIAR